MPRKRQVGIEVFEDEDNNGIELSEDDEISNTEVEKLMAKETAKAKSRREAAEVEEDEDEDETEVEDDAEEDEDESEEDENEDEDEEDEDEDEADSDAFIPWIYHSESDWELSDAFKAVDSGDDVVVYDVDNNVWYKLMPIKVGELPAAASTQ